MFAYVLDNIVQFLIQPGVEFTINGVTYPGNWIQLSSTAEQQSLGIYEVVYGPQANDQYYWITQEAPVFQNNQVVINYTSTPKDLVTVQSTSVNNVNQQAYTILQPTDWLVIRSVESGGTYPVPQSWNTWRQSIRTQASVAVNQINAATNVDEVAAVFPVAWNPNPDTPPPQISEGAQ
jgi:hypothetical protein